MLLGKCCKMPLSRFSWIMIWLVIPSSSYFAENHSHRKTWWYLYLACFFFFFYRHLPCFVCTGIRSSWQGTLRWFQETVCVWWLPVVDGYRTTPESKEEPGPGVGRGIMRKQSTWVWQARGESSRKLKPEEGRRNSGWNHSRAVESRRAPWEIVDLVRGPWNQVNSSPAGMGMREGWATALVSGGHEESTVHCNLGISCEIQPARTLFPLRDWGLGGAWVARGWIMVYWEEKASLWVKG